MDHSDITIRDGFSRMDFERVRAMLATAYWSVGISRAEVMQGARHSALVVGAFEGEVQVGYARVISDCTRFAYLSDVFVDESRRGRGIAKAMVRHILSHETLRDVYQWTLKTVDAHPLYRGLGFEPLPDTSQWMAIVRPRPER